MYQAIIYAVIALWLSPGSLWRPVALALLLQWSVAEGVYLATRDHVSLPVYIVGDCAVVAVVLLWRSHWSDWLVVAPLPLVWCLYVMPETRGQWEALYWIALGQFVVAGPWPKLQGVWGQVSHGPLRGKVSA